MPIVVTTNNVPRDLMDGFELPESARSDFDYLNWEAIDKGEENASFFRYRGSWYCLDQFTAVHNDHDNPILNFKGWSGYMSDTFFSGILIRWANDQYDSVVVARYYEKD